MNIEKQSNMIIRFSIGIIALTAVLIIGFYGVVFVLGVKLINLL